MTIKYHQIVKFKMEMSSITQDISGLFLDPDTERFNIFELFHKYWFNKGTLSATVGALELKYVKELK
ncbi:10187_t:CDS:2 [Entrophospora sp. SA101]|nr:10187_t:CDS:2 [Entrophospora sp. SA101]